MASPLPSFSFLFCRLFCCPLYACVWIGEGEVYLGPGFKYCKTRRCSIFLIIFLFYLKKEVFIEMQF